MSINTYPNLLKPPIQVVIFQIGYTASNFTFPPKTTIFEDLIKEWFPNKNHNTNINIDLKNINPAEKKINVEKSEIDLLRYISEDKSKNLSFSKNLFSLTINKTYTNWDDYISQFRKLWDMFKNNILLDGYTIDRASSRFINRIEVLNMDVPSNYFNTTIYASENVIPGVVATFLMNYSSNITEDNIQLQVTQGFEPPISNISPYFFDIDVISIQAFDDDSLWATFSKIREVKNKTFFNNLTEKTLTLLS